MTNKKMKIVVTGGSGFIGSHLTELLLSMNYEVTVIDSLITGRKDNLSSVLDEINFIEADLVGIPSQTLCEIFDGVDVVIHLAAIADIVPSVENPVKYFDNNVRSTIAVVEAARIMGVKRIVYAASSSCYGDLPSVPTSVDHPISCRYPYALSKKMGEDVVSHWATLYGLEFISLRLFNIYGPRARTSGTYGAVLGVFLAQHLNGRALTIVGDGSQKRDFTYVTDVAKAFALASELGKPTGVFNISLGDPKSILELADLISQQRIFIPYRPGEPDITWGDSLPFRESFNWKPSINLEDGVSKCLDNISWLNEAPVWTPESIHDATTSWFKYLQK